MKKIFALVFAVSLGTLAQAETLDCYTEQNGTRVLFASIEHKQTNRGHAIIAHNDVEAPYYFTEQVRTESDGMNQVSITDRTYYQIKWQATDKIHLTQRCGGAAKGCQIQGQYISVSNNGRMTDLSCKYREE